MTQIQLNIADEQVEQIRRRAAERGLSTVEAYLQNLVDEDLSIDEDLEDLLLTRINGPFIDWNEDEERKLQTEIVEELKNRPTR